LASLQILCTLVGAYLLGAVPVGLVIVKLIRGRDIRYWFSGRTGGTNVMRMAGFWAGFATGVGDLIKGLLAVLGARTLTSGNVWLEAVAGLLVIVGHNYSIFLLERTDGRVRLRGGAGGASTAGAVIGLWAPAAWIIVPIGLALLYGVGYASVATMSVGLTATGIFLWRAVKGLGPWAYVLFAVLAEGLLLWALRPNIGRLRRGEERIVGLRASRGRRRNQRQHADDNSPA
jgi:glycerol-3-phosphate acyltransferase PlsY